MSGPHEASRSSRDVSDSTLELCEDHPSVYGNQPESIIPPPDSSKRDKLLNKPIADAPELVFTENLPVPVIGGEEKETISNHGLLARPPWSKAIWICVIVIVIIILASIGTAVGVIKQRESAFMSVFFAII